MHIKLRQYRVLQIIITGWLIWAMYRFTIWMTATPYADLDQWQAGVIGLTVPALVAGLVGFANNIAKVVTKDD
jgi:hypothetical protein